MRSAAFALALILGLTLTSPAEATPVTNTTEIRGKGYGHGHGMSQHGAQGAALGGMGYSGILKRYYPGTETGEVHGIVRVDLSTNPSTAVRLRWSPGLRVTDLRTGRTWPLAKQQIWRLRKVVNRNVVEYRDGNGWHQFRAFKGVGQFEAAETFTMITGPGQERRYRGAVRQVRGQTINVVWLEDYIRGVLPAEMPTSWQMAALRAQAVAARTYAWHQRNQRQTESAQLCDTTACQVYRGFDQETPRGNNAVDATLRQIRTWQGKAAFTQFSASSGGWTAAGSQPYLVAAKDPYDNYPGNPHRNWTVPVNRAALDRAFPKLGRITDLAIIDRGGRRYADGGRVERIRVTGTNGQRVMSGSEFRFALGLKSTWFAIWS